VDANTVYAVGAVGTILRSDDSCKCASLEGSKAEGAN
jgi:hypothetical protein